MEGTGKHAGSVIQERATAAASKKKPKITAEDDDDDGRRRHIPQQSLTRPAMPPISSVKTAEDDASSVLPCLNGAHAARNKRKLGDHRPRAKRNRSLPSPGPIPTRAIHGPSEGGGGGGGGRLYNGTTRNQSISIAVLAVLQAAGKAGRKEGRGQCSQSDCCSNATRSKQAAGRPSCPWGPGASSSKLETVTFPPSALDG